MQYEIIEQPPTPAQFIALRALVGWVSPSLAVVSKSMVDSLYWVSIYKEKTLIGTGRVVGDGAMYFYLQDIVVHPNYQRRGLGGKLMHHIENYLKLHAKPGATVGLFATQGKEAFYKQFDYTERGGDNLGLGMCKFIGLSR